jgi:LysR family transcriptional regulator, low CO2-responsive transcriptional regulator
METRLLRIFCAVAESRSLVAAADKVHLTPSAVSHSLKALETELGCRLFERVGKRMALNHAGEQLLAQIQEPLAALDTAAEGIKNLGKWGQSRLRVGASSSACEHILPRVIRELKRHHPSLQLHVESGDTARLLDLLHQHKVDLALSLTPANPTALAVRPAFKDELMFVFPPDHNWADGRPITLDEIRAQPFIAYQRSSLTAQLVEDYFRQLHITPGVIMEVASTAAILQLVKNKLGVSIVAPWAAEPDVAQGALKMRPLGSKSLWRRWSVISLASHRMTLAEETFCRFCRTCTAGMRLDRRDLPPLKQAAA